MTTKQAARVRLVFAALVAAGAIGVALLAPGGPAPAHAAQKEQPGAKGPAAKPKDPLHPTGPNDVATGYAACRACHAERLPYDPDNTFIKNYKSNEFVLLTEGRTWTSKDPHSSAFKVLSTPLGKQMSGILKYDVTKAPQCLTCHAIDKFPGEPLPKVGESGARFSAVENEGVTCNVCHGLRIPWQSEHYKEVNGTIPWRTMTPDYKEKAGMRNLRDPVVKAQLCATCHVGDPDLHRVVTHEMYAAGHPPLPPFELGTFIEGEPQHWGYPVNPELKFFTDVGYKEFAKTEPKANWRWDLYRFHPADQEVYMARQMSAGAIASLAAEMKMLAADAESVVAGHEGAIDFARFDCFACHHDLKYPSARQQRGYTGAPGRPTLKAWTAALPSIVADHARSTKVLGEAANGFMPKWDAVQSAALVKPFGQPKEVNQSAGDMVGWCQDFMKRYQAVPTPVYTKGEATRLLTMIGDAAIAKKWTADPEAAMHLTWAYLTLRKGLDRQLNDADLAALAKVVPVRVRAEPFDTKDGPQTVGATLRQRLDVFSRYDAGDFTAAFRGIHGKK